MTAAMQSALKEALEKSQKKREEEYHRNLSTVKVRGARAFTRQGLSGTPEHRPAFRLGTSSAVPLDVPLSTLV